MRTSHDIPDTSTMRSYLINRTCFQRFTELSVPSLRSDAQAFDRHAVFLSQAAGECPLTAFVDNLQHENVIAPIKFDHFYILSWAAGEKGVGVHGFKAGRCPSRTTVTVVFNRNSFRKPTAGPPSTRESTRTGPAPSQSERS